MEGVSLAAISVDAPAVSADLATRLGLRFPLLSDPSRTVIVPYGVAMVGQDIAVPATLIVDRHRQIVYRHVGETMTDRPSILVILEELKRLRRIR